MATAFPSGSHVGLTVTWASPAVTAVTMVLNLRVPSWLAAPLAVTVNNKPFGTGTPGSYLAVDRTWSSGDTVAFDLPSVFKLNSYTGRDQVPGFEGKRYALQVRVTSRSISPPWGSTRFRLALRTYAPWGVRVVSQTKSRKIPTLNIFPLFFVLQALVPETRPPKDRTPFDWKRLNPLAGMSVNKSGTIKRGWAIPTVPFGTYAPWV